MPRCAECDGVCRAGDGRGADGGVWYEVSVPVALAAETLTIVKGTAYLGVSVKTNGEVTAEQKSWGKVKFDKDVKVDVSADGTELVIPVPANAEKGFMVLESGEAERE